jgi:hypothetical protein
LENFRASGNLTLSLHGRVKPRRWKIRGLPPLDQALPFFFPLPVVRQWHPRETIKISPAQANVAQLVVVHAQERAGIAAGLPVFDHTNEPREAAIGKPGLGNVKGIFAHV